MKYISNKELIVKAVSVIHKRVIGSGDSVGAVGCALVSERGRVFTGVSIDTNSGMGFCAEHNAIGSMITAGEQRILKIVAARKDENGNLYVLAPCGRCRHFMFSIDESNLDADVLLDEHKTIKLTKLIPYRDVHNRISFR